MLATDSLSPNFDAQSTTAQESVLCNDCRVGIETSTLLKTPLRGFEAFRNSTSRASILISSSNGCHLCTLLLEKIGTEEQNPLNIKIHVSRSLGLSMRIETTSNSGIGLRELTITPITPDSESGLESTIKGPTNRPKFFDFPRAKYYLYPQNHLFHPAQLAKSTSSNASFDLAKEWLRQCMGRHKRCQEVARSPPDFHLPSRLIDVGVQSEDPIIVKTTHLGPNIPRYLALSHCWGSAHIARLLLKNVESMSKGVRMSALPKTFYDAVIITRRLGSVPNLLYVLDYEQIQIYKYSYRYLWIDSLCIIQDSKEDWLKESAVMGEVYSNAECTIGALTSTNSQGGCFVNRNPLSYRPCKIEVGGQVMFIEGTSPGGVDLRDAKLQPLHLHTRAWVVQERLLSPRTLYYGSMGLAWECAECSATESIPEGEISRFSPKASFFTIRRREPGAIKEPESLNAAYQEWLAVQISYTRCSLTKFEDKLIAISGAIKQIENLTGWTNIYGLWKEHFLKELLWFVEEPTTRPDTSPAPSWSWASVIGRVMMVSTDTERVDAVTTWPAKIKQFPAEPHSPMIRLEAPIRPVECLLSNTTCKLRPTHGKKTAWNEIDWDPDVTPDIAQKMWCVLVVRVPSSHNESVFDVGLVVTQVEEGKDQWKRVGIFRQMHDLGFETLFPLDSGAFVGDVSVI